MTNLKKLKKAKKIIRQLDVQGREKNLQSLLITDIETLQKEVL